MCTPLPPLCPLTTPMYGPPLVGGSVNLVSRQGGGTNLRQTGGRPPGIVRTGEPAPQPAWPSSSWRSSSPSSPSCCTACCGSPSRTMSRSWHGTSSGERPPSGKPVSWVSLLSAVEGGLVQAYKTGEFSWPNSAREFRPVHVPNSHKKFGQFSCRTRPKRIRHKNFHAGFVGFHFLYSLLYSF